MSEPIIERLVSRLAGIQPRDRTSESDLAVAHALVASGLRQEAEASGASDEALANLDAEIRRLLGESAVDLSGTLIETGPGVGLAIPFPGFPDPIPQAAALRNLGLFRTDTGGGLTLSLATPAPWDEVAMDGSSVPVLFAPPGSVTSSPSEVSIGFEEGTFWLLASTFVEDMPPAIANDTYVGFSAEKMKAVFKRAGSGATLASPIQGQITIQLSFPSEAIEVCGGVSLFAPQEVTVTWDGAGGVSVEFSGGAVDVDGNRIDLTSNGDVSFDAIHRRIVLGADPSQEFFDLEGLQHRFARLGGTPNIDRAGWVLPMRTLLPWSGLTTLEPFGGWAFWLQGDAELTWEGLSDGTTVPDPWLEIATDGWRTEGKASASETDFGLSGWEVGGGPQPLNLTLVDDGPTACGCDDVNGDFVAFSASLGATLSRLLDTSGTPITLPESRVSALITDGAETTRQISVRTVSAASGPTAQLALENVLFSARDIALASLRGSLVDSTRLEAGRLRLSMHAFAWLPILPDPYVANVDSVPLEQRSSEVFAEVIWSDEIVSVAMSGGLDNEGLTPLPASQPGARGTGIEPGNLRKDGQTRSGRALRSKKAEAEFRRQQSILKDFQGAAVSRKGQDIWARRRKEFDVPRARLLDVSTRRDQIGVALTIDPRGGRAAPFRLSGLRAQTDLSDLRVFALPQIQWEPVRTLDEDQDLITLGYFPTPLASADDGGATQIASASATLAPIIPDLTVDHMVHEFGDGAPMQMVTTLPFGIKALMQLRPNDSVDQKADIVRRVEPTFTEPAPLVGGLQIAIEAGERNVAPPAADPGLQGWTFQQPNGVDLATGAPRFISVLGSTLGPDASVEALFNQEFLISRPKVPLTRLDISGYGALTFSDWRNPFAAFAEASKVEFQVMVGRTALEIVKFVSVIYPWGIRVTRSVTIERGSGAGVVRRDSGWQATSSGLLDFRYVPEGASAPVPSPYTIHPGLIRGLFDIRRIRPADRGRIELPNGGAVQPMMFDAEIELGTDATYTRTQSVGILGYLHLEPVGAPITPDDLEALLETMGPAGGPLDTELELDASGLTCRIIRAEMASARDPGGPALAGAVVGLPEFSSAGSWSVAAFPGPAAGDEPPEATIVDEGTPLIRQGVAGPPQDGRIDVPAPADEIRFADPADLFRPAAPERDYAFLQVTPTHSFAYRRPFLEAGSSVISAGLPSLFADVLVRTVGSTLFPPEDIAITLPSATALVVDSGVPRLDAAISMPVTRGPVSLSDSDMGSGTLEYGSTTLALNIGTNDWSVMMPGLEVQNSILGIDNISGLRFDLVGGSAVPDRLDNIKSLLGGFFGEVFEAIPGLGPQTDIPPYELRATNLKHKVKFKILQKHGSDKLAGGFLALYGTIRQEFGWEEIAVPEDKLPPGAEDLKLEIEQGFHASAVGFQMRGEIPVGGGWTLVLGVSWDLGFQIGFGAEVPGGGRISSKTKVVSDTRAEVGAGYGGDLGVFKAKGYLIGIFLYTIQGDAIGFGLGIRWEFKAYILIVEVKAYMEALGILLLEPPKKYLIGQAEVGINVKIAMFFSIKFSLAVSVKGEI